MLKLLSKIFVLLLPLALALSSCGDQVSSTPQTPTDQTMKHHDTPHIKQEKFGSVDGQDIIQYTLSNPAGMEVKIINYGGTLTSIMVPDSAGRWGDVLLGFDSLQGYLQKENPYIGCLVGRYANRIANGKFTVNGKVYQLPLNNNGNSLHGGQKGFSRVVWTAKPLPETNSVQLNYHSKDGEEGYPGSLNVQVVYTVTNVNELKIEYLATTDKGTPVNLTNHAYFNLSAGKDSTVLGHTLTVNADHFTVVNDKQIPTGALDSVKGTPMDFNQPLAIKTNIDKVPGGYDHNWALRKSTPGEPELAATLYHQGTGRRLEVFTTEPGIQVYTGNFLDGSLTGKYGRKYVKHSGICLETQHFPDSPNHPSFPSTLLRPGEKYRQTTIYKFSTR
ncbi:MAG: galactose mutarotase [Chitinophagaceae bacterium]|nr:galactose mutarotase [Chitinophagaceae bacterium]